MNDIESAPRPGAENGARDDATGGRRADSAALLECVEVVAPAQSSDGQPRPAAEAPDAAVIWLHGLGADGHDFEPIVPHLRWPGAPAIRFVFPHAPVRPVTLNGGMPMRAWYDIIGIDSDRGHDAAGIAESMQQVARLIERERSRGVAASRIVLAGFSQGGAIALQLALRWPERLAGVMALSTYLLHAERLADEASADNGGLPAFVAHGVMDPVVPFSMGETAANTLRQMAYAVEWHSYPMQHAVCPQEIADIATWLRRVLD